MTFEERLAALGVDLSDLPESDGKHLTYDKEKRSAAEHEVFKFAKQGHFVDIIDCLAMHQDYILHLTDIIDRMETRLVNVTGERDWLKEQLEAVWQDDPYYSICSACKNFESMVEKNCVAKCVWEFGGVPEDWSEDE